MLFLAPPGGTTTFAAGRQVVRVSKCMNIRVCLPPFTPVAAGCCCMQRCAVNDVRSPAVGLHLEQLLHCCRRSRACTQRQRCYQRLLLLYM